METSTSLEWAQLEFGGAALGNALRTQRLVRLAAATLDNPAGTITGVMKGSAEREGAFRFVENGYVRACDIARSSHEATVRRCSGSWVFVAVDQTTVSITDCLRTKGLGPIGDRREFKARGVEVMSALVVSPQGMPIGLAAQQWRRRTEQASPDYHHDKRPAEERESDLWLQALRNVTDRFSGSDTRPWFQLDRGGDFWRVFEFAERNDAWLTVRSAYDRNLWDDPAGLNTHVSRTLSRGSMNVCVPACRPLRRRARKARTAKLEVRFEPVTLDLTDYSHQKFQTEVTAVHVEERGRHSHRIRWRLLTTYPVKTLADAKQVVRGYSQRWRIEDFHRAWKSGHCHVERSQLRSPDAFCRWATILATVAARIEQLKHLSRTTPNVPATDCLSRTEIDAAIVLSRTRKHLPGDDLTLQQAVWLIAEAGGYTGKSSGGPPGTITISRGMRDVAAAAFAIDRLKPDEC